MNFDISDCWPLSLTRDIESFPIGNLPLAEHQKRVLAGSGLVAHPRAWIAESDISAFLTSGRAVLTGTDGSVLAWKSGEEESDAVFPALSSFLIRYSWDFLRANEGYISGLEKSEIDGDVHPSAVIEGVVQLGAGARILPGVFIEGNVVIGANCKIGPNCYLRGSTSIGDSCHIGQSVEIKNCLILSHTNVGHLSYVGDSVLGEGVNLGAGTIVSNLRHDGKNHRSKLGGLLVDTGRRKFGTIIGDHVHTGIQTSIYPGRKLWPHTSTLPAEVVRDDVMGGA
jgi:carbonic anhydrase/acetyltransferase-like protein (isoleucine patch superfamily)